MGSYLAYSRLKCWQIRITCSLSQRTLVILKQISEIWLLTADQIAFSQKSQNEFSKMEKEILCVQACKKWKKLEITIGVRITVYHIFITTSKT